MTEWKPDGIYVINNFDSGYLTAAVNGGSIFCAGEIDPAIALLNKPTEDICS